MNTISANMPWSVFPRKKLDISLADIAVGIHACATSNRLDRNELEKKIENFWSPEGNAMVCLSIRTGFDLLLRALNLPKGSEVICSAITIPDMIYLIRYHGLIPVPVDLEHSTCAPKVDLFDSVVTKNTKLILLAHIFGARYDVKAISQFAKKNNLLLIEDCAQSFTGPSYKGHSGVDISMFSFGTIKTATAFGGAIINVSDFDLLSKMRKMNEMYQPRSIGFFLKRLIKYATVHGLSSPAIFGILLRTCNILGVNHDSLITSLVRGFSGDNLITLLRQRPSVPLLALLWHRLSTYNGVHVAERKRKSEMLKTLIEDIPDIEIPGKLAEDHSYWLFPIIVQNPNKIGKLLTADGFDVTSGATQLTFIPRIEESSKRLTAEDIMKSLIYLPITADMPIWAIEKMAASLRRAIHGTARL